MPQHYYATDPKVVLVQLGTTPKGGLFEEEAKRRLDQHGYNELQEGKKITAFQIFLNQFTNFLIILLLIATLLSVIIGEFLDAIAMASIALLSVILGFIQEYRAERAVEVLEKITAPIAKVIRNSVVMRIPARELVPGDIVLLEAGDISPADGRIVEVSNLQIDEASLTGESVPSKKVMEPFKLGTSIADQENMAFMGTVVTYGKGIMVVVATGMNTELGKVASSLQTATETKTPLQVKFERMAREIGIAVLALCAVIFIIGLLRGELSVEKLLLFSLSLAVAAVPSSLPAIVTISLALGVKTLSSKNMIVRKLPAAESLGAVTIICSDKTGTLTKNQMTITRLFTENRLITVSGSGYEPTGSFFEGTEQCNPQQFELLQRTGVLCNNARLKQEDQHWTIIGDPTEGSLIVLGKKGGVDQEHLAERFSFVEELPFDSDRKRMSVIHKNLANGRLEVYVKGAPEMLLESCTKILINGKVRPLTAADKKRILETNLTFAQQALRVLGIGYREAPTVKKYTIENVERELVFLGLVGMIDPPREEVAQAVADCHDAGIETMVITGDHAVTAKAVAQQIGIFREGDLVLTGEELDRMNDQELAARIHRVRIIARSLPIQKLRIVEALQKRGHIVAMTGDGVNDAPALKKADIGVSMGISGTDVAKEVSKAILVDDNFATIVNAVKEGRTIYDKIVKSTRYLLSCNCGEIVSVFLAVSLQFPLPLIPLQILLMNLLTDGFPALGLGMEKTEVDTMLRPPRNPKESPLSKHTLILVLLFGVIMGMGTLYMFTAYLDQGLKMAQTVAFTTLVMFEMFAVIGSRSLHPFRHMNPFSNLWLLAGIFGSVLIQFLVIYWKPLQLLFGTVSISLSAWGHVLLVSALGYVLMELGKFFMPSFKQNRGFFKNSAKPSF